MSHFRYNGPKLTLVAPLDKVEDQPLLQLEASEVVTEICFTWQIDISAVAGVIWRHGASGLVSLGVSVMAVDQTRVPERGHQQLLDMDGELRFQTLYPAAESTVARAPRRPNASKAVKKLLKSISLKDDKAEKATVRAPPGLRMKFPRLKPPNGDPVNVDSGSDVLPSDDGSASSVSSVGDFSDGAHSDASADSDKLERESRQIMWGRFAIAPCHKSRYVHGVKVKEHTGWGATCSMHNDVGDGRTTRCQTKRAGTCDETRRLVQWWCILGRAAAGQTGW